MKLMKSKKKRLLVTASALALIALGAGTFAWFSSQDDVKNHFEGAIAGNDIQIVETYEPETEWKPGGEVNKDVAIANISEYTALARVSFKETLELLIDNNEIHFDGTAYTWASGTNNGNTATVTNPMAMPSQADYANQGYTLVTDKLSAAVSDMTVDGTAYSFKMYEKQTKAASNPSEADEYAYVAQWEAADGTKAKGFIGNTSGVVARDASGGLTLSITPKLSVIDKTYQAAVTGDWTNPVYTKSVANENTFKAYVDDNIQLNFVNVTATPTADKWYFNAQDGFFYYTTKILPGAQTPQLLDSVTLLGDAGNEYSLLQFDLNVHTEGIQAVKQAITDQWAGVAAVADLKTLLEAQCDY